MSVTVSAATMFATGMTFAVFVVVVVAFCIRVVLKSIVKVSLHRFVCVTLNTAEQLNSRIAKCHLCASANATANKHINIECRGQQFKVEKGKKIFVHRLAAEVGASLDFDKVLLTDNEGQVKVGAPYVEGAVVKATVLDHVKGEKVIVFKKKRRKGYQKKNGHRQCLSQIQIEEIA